MASESALASPEGAAEAAAAQEQDELDIELEEILEIVSPKDGGGGKINEVRCLCVNVNLADNGLTTISHFRACLRFIDSSNITRKSKAISIVR